MSKKKKLKLKAVTRLVQVNRDRTPYQMLDATNRSTHTDGSRWRIEHLPKGKGEFITVVLFPSEAGVGTKKLKKEYRFHGLKPVDPYTLAALNEAAPTFADKCPNSTVWQDSNGDWRSMTFNLVGGVRAIYFAGPASAKGGKARLRWMAGIPEEE